MVLVVVIAAVVVVVMRVMVMRVAVKDVEVVLEAGKIIRNPLESS